jgi:hypothetical protein
MPFRIKGRCVMLKPNKWSRLKGRIQCERYRNKSKTQKHIIYRSVTEEIWNGFMKSKVSMGNDILMVKIKHTTYMSIWLNCTVILQNNK